MESRIKRINPDQLHRPPSYHHVSVVQASRMAYLAGQCPIDRHGDLAGPGDLAAQIDQVIANVVDVLSAVDARPEDVVRSVIYIVTEDVDELATAWYRLTESVIGPAFTSASTLLGVAQLGYPGQLVEVELTAALPAD